MINLSIPRDEQELKPRITVVGVGGAGERRQQYDPVEPDRLRVYCH